MLEILAPAGNLECAKAAIHSGANAIYLGTQAFSARQNADNFDAESLRAVIFEAHLFEVKVYIAMNTAVKNSELDEFLRTLLSVWSLGVDAIILQDALLGKVIHRQYPDIVLHLSTQAGVCSLNGARFAKECGFSRVILARETPLAEMKAISEIIETEAFVQGALCTCFSGQCYFSSFAGGNSGNRGRCKQPCRKLYSYNRNGESEKTYALSPSDLSVGADIQKYLEAGICSVKIEGRMRRAEYVAAAVEYYRAILENKNALQELSALKRTYNRGNYTKGLAFGQDKRFLSTVVQGHLGEKVGVVKVINGEYTVESLFTPTKGDAFKILRDGKEIGGAAFVKNIRRGFVLSSKSRLKNGDGVFLTTDTALNTRLLSISKKKQLSLILHFHENEYAIAEAEGICVYSQERLSTAQNRPLSEDEVKSCFEKTDGLPIEIVFDCVDVQGNCFLPKSQLNAFRRAFYLAFISKIIGERALHNFIPFGKALLGGNNKTAVISSDFDGVVADIAIYKPFDYRQQLPKSFLEGSFEKYIYYPAYCPTEQEHAIEQILQKGKIDGIYAENYGAFSFAREHGLCVFAGTGLNLFNGVAAKELLSDERVSYYAVSKELNEREQAELISNKAFVLQMGALKVMDLCYCPFSKTCAVCDKKPVYTLTDENGRVFPIRRYIGADGNCRFEVYNCAMLVGEGVHGAGAIVDASLEKIENTDELLKNIEKQKQILTPYTFGHAKRGVL